MKNKIVFHNIFLDFNGCIHNCSNQLKSSDINFLSNNEFEKALIENVLKYIDFCPLFKAYKSVSSGC